MYSSLPLAADAPCKSVPQMSHAAPHQLGLLALENFVVASNKYHEALTQAELPASPPHAPREAPAAVPGSGELGWS